MKRITIVVCFIALVIGMQFWIASARVARNALPKAVQDTLDRELDNYRLRNITQGTDAGKTIYRIEARGRESRKLRMTIGEDGSLLKKIFELQFRMVDGRLFKEERPFTMRSVYTPDAGDPAKAPKAFYESVSKISYSGGNILAFDIYGLKPDGSGFTKEADDFYQNMIDRLIYTKIGCFCRLFEPEFPKDSKIRLNAVRTVAEYFLKQNQFIFWIDGPDAEQLAKEFKTIAPGLVVAAPGGDLNVSETFSKSDSKTSLVTIGPLPNKEQQNNHFLLEDRPENYLALDEMNSFPVDHEAWIPDNSNLSEEERKEGFVSLFDGKTTNGWTPISRNGTGYTVKDGTFQRVPRGGSIRTVKRFDDFILRYEYQIDDGGNSGVQLRCPRSNRASKIGFEVQILGDYGRPPNKNSTGSIYNVIAPTVNASKPGGEWNAIEITCKGPHVRVVLNGQVVQDVDFDDYDELRYRLRNGFIYLTDHGNYVAYRNIRIKEI